MLIDLLTGKLIPFLVVVSGVLAAFFGYGLKKRRDGVKAQKAKQAAASAKARDKRDEIDDAVADRTDDEKRKELGRWSK